MTVERAHVKLPRMGEQVLAAFQVAPIRRGQVADDSEVGVVETQWQELVLRLFIPVAHIPCAFRCFGKGVAVALDPRMQVELTGDLLDVPHDFDAVSERGIHVAWLNGGAGSSQRGSFLVERPGVVAHSKAGDRPEIEITAVVQFR